MKDAKSKTLDSHTIQMLKAAVPYVDKKTKRSMGIIIQTAELAESLQGSSSEEISACDLEDEKIDLEAMFGNMRQYCNEKEGELIDLVLNFVKARKLYTSYQSFNAANSTHSSGGTGFNGTPFSSFGNIPEFLMSMLSPEQQSQFENLNMILSAMDLMKT